VVTCAKRPGHMTNLTTETKLGTYGNLVAVTQDNLAFGRFHHLNRRTKQFSIFFPIGNLTEFYHTRTLPPSDHNDK
jgi:hypothetical protein